MRERVCNYWTIASYDALNAYSNIVHPEVRGSVTFKLTQTEAALHTRKSFLTALQTMHVTPDAQRTLIPLVGGRASAYKRVPRHLLRRR